MKNLHNFWNTQPVIHNEQHIEIGKPIKDYNIQDIAKEPIKISDNYIWSDIKNPKEISEFINKYYVEDTTNTFRLNYTEEFLKLILDIDYEEHSNFQVGIRLKSTNELMCFISATIINVGIDGLKFKTNMVNFLCIHPKLRKKNITPILIKEITRRVYLKGNFQAIYTSEKLLSKPLTSVKYYHRILNLDNCLKTKFKEINGNIKMYNKLYEIKRNTKFKYAKLSDNMNLSNIILNNLNSYLESNFKVYQYFGENGFNKLFNNTLIQSYLVYNSDNMIGFISYYKQNILVTNCNKILVTGNLFYYYMSDEYLLDVMADIPIIAKKENCDIFNVTDIMKHHLFIKKLKFDEGTGISNYYIYNWSTNPINTRDLAINIF